MNTISGAIRSIGRGFGRLFPVRMLGLLAASLLMPLACTPTGPDTSGFGDAGAVAADVATGNLMPFVQRLAQARSNDIKVSNTGFETDELFPSDQLTRDSAVVLVSQALTAMGYAPRTVVLGEGPQAAYNVVAEWPGVSRPSDVILVGAHLDAFYAGADDNGSAVAALLETARAVRLHRFAKSIRFVAFDLEEFGSVGSTRYVQAGLAGDVDAAIILEMVGFASNEPGSQKDIMGIKLPDKGDFLFVLANDNSSDMAQRMVALGNSTGLAKLVGVVAPGDGAYFISSPFMRSDNGLLWFQGIPSLMLTDGANFRNPHYHLPSDTPETLDPEFLARNTRAITAAVALFAEVQP